MKYERWFYNKSARSLWDLKEESPKLSKEVTAELYKMMLNRSLKYSVSRMHSIVYFAIIGAILAYAKHKKYNEKVSRNAHDRVRHKFDMQVEFISEDEFRKYLNVKIPTPEKLPMLMECLIKNSKNIMDLLINTFSVFYLYYTLKERDILFGK